MPLKQLFSQTETHNTSISHKKKLGLIAGQGELPKAIASEAKKMGYEVTVIALQPFADEPLEEFAENFHKISIGKFGKIIKLLKKSGITEALIAGKVNKGLLYQDRTNLMPDLRAIKFLLSLKDYSDSTLLNAVDTELKNEGITLLKTISFTKNLLTPFKVLTKKQPSKSHWKDIEFGWGIAKEIGRLDIGQTVVVKEMAVMAVEATEGTDEAILRGGSLAGDGAVVVKVSRPQQDMRLDVPVAGLKTLLSMKKAKAAVLALEAGKSIIVDREDFIKEADRAGIVVAGISDDKFK